jgi:hypothetical protein
MLQQSFKMLARTLKLISLLWLQLLLVWFLALPSSSLSKNEVIGTSVAKFLENNVGADLISGGNKPDESLQNLSGAGKSTREMDVVTSIRGTEAKVLGSSSNGVRCDLDWI